ncbi:MAG: transglycosylase-like protein [Actinomycetia bacterium]|nr:transglycosylase-like protein [Actinomycetes bacterium]
MGRWNAESGQLLVASGQEVRLREVTGEPVWSTEEPGWEPWRGRAERVSRVPLLLPILLVVVVVAAAGWWMRPDATDSATLARGSKVSADAKAFDAQAVQALMSSSIDGRDEIGVYLKAAITGQIEQEQLVAEAANRDTARYVGLVQAAQQREAELLYISGALKAQEAAAARNTVWDRMAQCETGGNWQMRGSRYSGGVGFANTTWNAFGGQEFASNAGLASREQQIVVAERVRAAVGFRAWGCAKRIGVG